MAADDRKAPASSATSLVVDGIVLAAGRSSRMGQDKAALELGGGTFLQRAIAALRDGGCRAITVVVAEGHAPELPARVAAVLNPDPESEQIASMRIALETLPGDVAGAVVLPVDAPAVRPETVRRLIEAFRATRAPIVRPVHAGRPGHPTLFARAVFAELGQPGLARGAETVVERHATEVVDVPVDDAAVTANVNTPDDYRRLRGEG